MDNTQNEHADRRLAPVAGYATERPLTYTLKQVGGAIWSQCGDKWHGPFGSRAKAHKAMSHTGRGERPGQKDA